MIPYIVTPLGNLSTFAIMIAVGFLSMIMSVHISIYNSDDVYAEEAYIFPKIILSAVIGYVMAAVFDSLFKIKINGGFKFSGITFYGGLIGACLSLYLLIKFSKTYSQYDLNQWYNILTIPLIVFHIFGRIGCFFAGCCYGAYTTSFWGICFPDNAGQNIFHFGKSRYPTQLFEAFILLVILLLILRSKKKFEMYLIYYSVSRFFIEFLRGDNRGYLLEALSPAQLISILILIAVSGYHIFKRSDS